MYKNEIDSYVELLATVLVDNERMNIRLQNILQERWTPNTDMEEFRRSKKEEVKAFLWNIYRETA